MTTITTEPDHTTLINVFDVAPERADQLVEVLTTASEQVMRYLPGFVSANIHVSADRTRVVNYAQWSSAQAYATIFDNPTVTEHMGRAAALANSFDPKLYIVASVYSAG